MKSASVCELSVNIENVPEAWRDACQPTFTAGSDKPSGWVLPVGHIFEGDEAIFRVKTGQAAPIDEECATACGMSVAQLAVAQRRYQAAAQGIKGKKDHELFMAGVIDGYAEGTTESATVYKPGKHWDAYQAALKAKKSEDE